MFKPADFGRVLQQGKVMDGTLLLDEVPSLALDIKRGGYPGNKGSLDGF